MLLVEPRAYTVLRTEHASELQLLRPPPKATSWLPAGARIVWGLHRDPLASPHNRPPSWVLRTRTPFSPGELGGTGRWDALAVGSQPRPEFWTQG